MYGDGRIWGIFPEAGDDRTSFAVYDPASDRWHLPPGSILEYLANSALTFQTLENGAVFLIGNEPEEPPVLYSYELERQSWVSRSVGSFLLGPGVSLAYVPNLAYNRQLYPVPGWLYCLPGEEGFERHFWRYSIPTSLPPVALDSIHPAEGAVIAEMAPLFLWPSGPEQPGVDEEYWLQVATETTFVSPVISVQITEPCYQVEEPLPNGSVYWRVAYRTAERQWVCGSVHEFTLKGGWSRLPDTPEPIGAGAALAYEPDCFKHISGGSHCLVAFVGGSNYGFYAYLRAPAIWYGPYPTPVEQRPGTALTTYIGSGLHRVKAIFGGCQDHYELAIRRPPEWVDCRVPLPAPGPGASLAYSADDYVYLVLGEDEQGTPRNRFLRRHAPAPESEEGVRSTQGNLAGLLPGPVRLTCTTDRIELEYHLVTAGRVRLSVYDVLGRRQAVLFTGQQEAGVHQATWDLHADGAGAAPGAYFMLLDAGLQQARLKVVVR